MIILIIRSLSQPSKHQFLMFIFNAFYRDCTTTGVFIANVNPPIILQSFEVDLVDSFLKLSLYFLRVYTCILKEERGWRRSIKQSLGVGFCRLRRNMTTSLVFRYIFLDSASCLRVVIFFASDHQLTNFMLTHVIIDSRLIVHACIAHQYCWILNTVLINSLVCLNRRDWLTYARQPGR